MRDYYEVLGVDRNADFETIKKAYRKKAMVSHPDRNPGDVLAEERFKEIQNAYDTLADSQKRAAYDRQPPHMRRPQYTHKKQQQRQQPPRNERAADDVFSEFFGGTKFRGRNIQVRIEIDLQESMTGCIKPIKVKKRQRCGFCNGSGSLTRKQCMTCNGTGYKISADAPFLIQQLCIDCDGKGTIAKARCSDCLGAGFTPLQDKTINVEIPRGVTNGMSIRIAEEGEESQKIGNIAGDLIVIILVKPHEIFRCEGTELIVDVPVSYTQCVLGDKITIPTMDGTVEVDIPPGSQSNTRFRLKNRGLMNQKGHIGDLVAIIKVEGPKQPDGEYVELLKKLSEMEKQIITPKRDAWAKKVARHHK